MRRLFIYGFPGLYGGAATELHHQFYIWKEMPDIELHIIPTMAGYENEPLYSEMSDMGVTIHKQHFFGAIKPEDALINFCSSTFLDNVRVIKNHTRRTIFVNCMTWVFDRPKDREHDEIGAHQRNDIAFSLYQRPQIRDRHADILKSHGSNAEFLHFIPYFHNNLFKFEVKDGEFTHIGRISRDSSDKYTKFNSHIYEGIHSPKPKVGHWLGFGTNAKQITGDPPPWVKLYRNQTQFSVKGFYDTIDFIVQPTQTEENWPRIGFEAMHSGKPLVVDKRGGWEYMIEHGKTGFLCEHERDFMYYGSRLAYDLDLRTEIAHNARERAQQLGGFEQSYDSWRRIFERVFS